MVKKSTIAIAAAAAVLAIGGGVGVATAANLASAPESTTTQVAEPTDIATDDAAIAPTEAPSPTVTPWPYTEAENGRVIYLKAVRAPDSINGIELPDDAELIADGRKACDQLAAGIPFNSVDVIADNPAPPMVNGKRAQITNSRSLAGLASETLCTEYNQQNVAP